MKYLGETFDIHVGGVDLMFPHPRRDVMILPQPHGDTQSDTGVGIISTLETEVITVIVAINCVERLGQSRIQAVGCSSILLRKDVALAS